MKILKPDVTYSDLPYNHIAGQNNTYNNTQKVKDIDVRKIKRIKMQRRSKISIGNTRGKSADVENKEKYQTYNKVSVSENSEINIGTLHRPKADKH